MQDADRPRWVEADDWDATAAGLRLAVAAYSENAPVRRYPAAALDEAASGRRDPGPRWTEAAESRVWLAARFPADVEYALQAPRRLRRAGRVGGRGGAVAWLVRAREPVDAAETWLEMACWWLNGVSGLDRALARRAYREAPKVLLHAADGRLESARG